MMDKEKPVCLIMTDSVALPRRFPGGMVKWKETYPFKLKEFLCDFEVISLSIGGASITDLRKQVNYYKILKPEIVILQCGIVDAAPRAFGRIEMDLIKKLKMFRITKPAVSFLRTYRAHHYTNPNLFEKKLRELKEELNAKDFFSLEIIPANKEYEKILFGITKNINIYNGILKRNSKIVPLHDIPRDGILYDHHHLNAIGQDFVFKRLKEILRSYS